MIDNLRVRDGYHYCSRRRSDTAQQHSVDKIFVRQGCSSFRGMTLLLRAGFVREQKTKLKLLVDVFEDFVIGPLWENLEVKLMDDIHHF